jgi:hypothetical protein
MPISMCISSTSSLRRLADLEGIAVERPHDLEAALAKDLVPQQGAPQVAHAHQGAVPGAVQAQGFLDGADELLDVVSHAPDAELAEIRQIFSYLRGVDRADAGQVLRGDYLGAVPLEVFQDLDVDRQTLDGGAGDVFAFMLHGAPISCEIYNTPMEKGGGLRLPLE